MAIIKSANQPLIDQKEVGYLTASVAAGSTVTLNMKDTSQFIANRYALLGKLGSEGSEVCLISSITSETALVVATVVSPHAIDDQVTQLDYNQVEFSWSATSTGAKSIPIIKDVEADDLYTTYNDTAHSTGYGFLRYYHEQSTTYSNYSSAILLTGTADDSVSELKKQALSITNEKVGDLITEDYLLDELNNWQRDIDRQKDWSWQLTSYPDSVVTAQKTYTLPTNIKYTSSQKAILQVYMEDEIRLEYIDKEGYEILEHDSPADGLPIRYTVYDGSLYLMPAASSTYSGDTLTFNYYKSIPTLTDDSSETIIPFYNIAQYYVAWKIEMRKGNKEQGDYWRQIYENRVAGEMRRDRSGQEARFVPLINGARLKR
jgi:hypothetical protein